MNCSLDKCQYIIVISSVIILIMNQTHRSSMPRRTINPVSLIFNDTKLYFTPFNIIYLYLYIVTL